MCLSSWTHRRGSREEPALPGKPPWSASPTRTPTAVRTHTPVSTRTAASAYGGQDWAQEGAYDEAAYTQPADEAGGAYGADAAYSQHVADDANDYGGQNTAASDDAVYDPAYAEEDYGDLDLDAGETRFPELEAAAASRLQACERGRAARKRHKATMEARSKTKSATALQARVRGRNERRKDRDFMRTPNAKAASPDPRTPGGGLTGDSLPDINNAAAPDPRTPGGGLRRRRSRLPRSASPRSRSWTTPRRSSARGGRRRRSLNSAR